MNPIEQMMECYGVEKKWRCFEKISVPYCEVVDCSKCKRYQNTYPLFTAEKQIELIKYIMEAPNTDELRMYYSEILRCYVFHWYSLPELDMRDSYSTQNTNYDFALAELVTSLKNELDQQRVKEILEV